MLYTLSLGLEYYYPSPTSVSVMVNGVSNWHFTIILRIYHDERGEKKNKCFQEIREREREKEREKAQPFSLAPEFLLFCTHTYIYLYMLHVHILIQQTRVLLQRTEDVDAAKTREKRSCEHAGKRARDLSRLCFSPLIRILIYSLFHSFSITPSLLLLYFFFFSLFCAFLSI